MFSPEPASVTAGRKFLYNATHTSALGDQACASCHIGGDFDGLAWDLGNPGNIPLPITPVEYAEATASAAPRATAASDAQPAEAAASAAFRATTSSPHRHAAGSSSSWASTADQGADDDAEPARPRQPRRRCTGAATATAPSSRRACRSSTAAATRSSRRSRTAASSTSSTRSSRSTSRSPASSATPQQLSDADMSAFATFALQITLPAEPDPQPRQLAHGRRRRPAQAFYFQTNADGSELPDRPLPQLQRLPHARPQRQRGRDAAPRLLRDRRAALVRERVADLQGPAPAQRVPEARHVRPSLDPGHVAARRSSRRSNPPASPSPRCAASASSTTASTATLEQFFAAFVFIQTTVPRDASAASQHPAEPGRHPVLHRPGRPATQPGATGSRRRGSQLRQRARVVRARVRHEPVPDRRPADHAHAGRRLGGRGAHRALRGAGRRRATPTSSPAARTFGRDARLHVLERHVRCPTCRRLPPLTDARAPRRSRALRPAHVHGRAAGRGLARRHRPRRRRLRRRRRAGVGTDPANPNSHP